MKLKLSLHYTELFYVLFAYMLPVALILENTLGVGFVGYTDEILAVVCLFYIIYMALRSRITGKDLFITIFLAALIFLTFIGNYISRVTTAWFPIMVDAVCLLKIFLGFIVYKQIAYHDKSKAMLRYMAIPSKLLIVTGAFFALVSQFVDIGMTFGDKRYGIAPYNFIFGANGGGSRYGYVVACCLLILMLTKMTEAEFRFYEILALFSMIMITKGVVYVVIVIYVVLKIMWRESSTSYKFSPLNIAFISVAAIAVSSFQINTYLKDYQSPRVTLIRYGIKTANRFFPFGSGFATYCSDMAAKNYSRLYYDYGFATRWGMSPQNPAFLNDGYLGMVFGQYGYFGAAIYGVILFLVFKIINKVNNLGKEVKAMTFAIFIGLLCSAIGTAIIKSSIGVYAFLILGIICGYSEQSYETGENLVPERKKRFKLNLKF
ncbi:MAG: hypothetical protein IJI47_00020 [Eubacterium sp.]|nr:hypothetical protein [Eubacterium sp.]